MVGTRTGVLQSQHRDQRDALQRRHADPACVHCEVFGNKTSTTFDYHIYLYITQEGLGNVNVFVSILVPCRFQREVFETNIQHINYVKM